MPEEQIPPESNSNNHNILEAIILAGIIFFIWFWTSSPLLRIYNLQLTAFTVILYFFIRFFLNRQKEDFSYQNVLLDVSILTAVMLLVISATGSLASPLFFIIYFYIFAFSLLFDPVTAIAITLCLCAFFFKELNSVANVLQAFSLLLFSPLAIYFGRQYLKLLESREKIKILSKNRRQLSREKQQVEQQVASQETSSLLWLSLDFKDSLLKIVHYTSELLADIGRLNFTQKEHLEKIHSTAKDILKSGEKLREKIDKETD